MPIDANGLTIKTEAELIDENTADYIAAFGNIDTDPNSPTGQKIAIESSSEALIYELAQAIYNSFNPDTAQGINLDNVLALNGKTRIQETFSRVNCTLGTVGGTPVIIPMGSLITQSSTNETWATLSEVTIPAFGTIDVLCQAQTPGVILAPISSMDVIATPISGWDSVDNTAIETVIGNLEETDPEFRLRASSNPAGTQAATLAGVVNAVQNIDGVTFAGGTENRGAFTDANGLRPHSYLILALGGLDSDILDTIFLVGGDGIETNGNTSGVRVDSLGNNVTVRFSRPTVIEIYLIVNVTANASYPANGDDLIKTALTDIVFTNGQTVINVELLAAVIVSGIPGITALEILQGTAPAPTLTDNIFIAIDEIANIDNANITVNS